MRSTKVAGSRSVALTTQSTVETRRSCQLCKEGLLCKEVRPDGDAAVFLEGEDSG